MKVMPPPCLFPHCHWFLPPLLALLISIQEFFEQLMCKKEDGPVYCQESRVGVSGQQPETTGPPVPQATACVCCVLMCDVELPGGPEMALDPLKLEIMVVSHTMFAGNWTWVLCRSGRCS